MKKLLLMLLAVAAFAGCSKEENVILSEGDKITRSIEQINTPLLSVLQSYRFWEESRTFAYTEPDGKGEEIAVFDAAKVASSEGVDYKQDPWGNWQPYEVLSYRDDQFVKYIPMTKRVRTYHYYDFDIVDFEDGIFTFTRNSEEYYLKVLAYDNNNLWIETNCYDKDKNYQKEFGRADSYPYVRILYTGLPEKSYPLEGWASEEEITPFKVGYPVVLPENFFDIAEDAPIWKATKSYSLVYDRDNVMFGKNLVVHKALGEKPCVENFNPKRGYSWYKFVDGTFYKISYELKAIGFGVAQPYFTISKCDNPYNFLLGITENNQIIISERDYKVLINEPYYQSGDFRELTCYYLSEGTEEDIEQIKQLLEDPDIKKE
ncbi:MAG: hypothetical protein IJB87_02210 [Alistipes sp.]|nr:hypothetical protein [Alistipes sp.]